MVRGPEQEPKRPEGEQETESAIPDAVRLLELCRNYLLLIANQELDEELQAKIGPSDLVQDTLMEAYRDLGHFHGQNSDDVRAWLRRILLNNIANARVHYRYTQKRAIGRERPLGTILEGGTGGQLASSEPTPSALFAGAERRRDLEGALSQLPAPYQEVIRLRHQEGCSFDEIGLRLGRSAEAARKLWARGVEQLKQRLQSP